MRPEVARPPTKRQDSLEVTAGVALTMADSIYPQNLPSGYDAYLGYVDGNWPTYSTLQTKFPGRHLLSLTVLGGTAVADGCDIETGDLTPASGAAWLKRRLSQGAHRPVAYASVSTMSTVLSELTAVGVTRNQVRLLSAHYDAGEHICGPATCGLISVPMDGTQWTNQAAGLNGTQIDASILADNFFSTGSPQGDIVQIPGIPGTWLTITQFIDGAGTEYVVGLGTNYRVYYTKRAAGGTWSAPARL